MNSIKDWYEAGFGPMLVQFIDEILQLNADTKEVFTKKDDQH
jgi:hypothetical protein